MMMRIALGLAVLLAMPSAQAQTTMRDRMVGIWFGSGQPGDQSQMYIDHFNADGSFRNQHRQCAQGKIADESREAGRWRMEGNTLVIDIATVNGQPVTIEYIGNAPTLVAGAVQINLRLPDRAPGAPMPPSTATVVIRSADGSSVATGLIAIR